MKHTFLAAFALGASALLLTAHAQSKVTCDADNGGPARHLAVAQNGDLFVAVQGRGGRGTPVTGGGVVALHDGNGDGKFDTREQFGSGNTTGIGFRNGYLYLAHPK